MQDMPRSLGLIVLLMAMGIGASLALAPPQAPPAQGRFADAEPPSAEWKDREIFKLKQDYPEECPLERAMPWSSIDFTQDPQDYMWAVLDYAYEGNVENDWRVEKNTKSGWYHVPWLHWGDNGREFIRGMTRERSSRGCELSQEQKTKYQNWAVSVYNDLGGYVIGRVWANPAAPNPMAADFPVGTVAIKLLFTQAPPKEVPFLRDSPEWTANINDPKLGKRSPQTVRLLQVDIGVREDHPKAETGWVFGTFQYDKDVSDTSSWRKLTPVALTWGNDPYLVPGGEKPSQSWINEDAPIVKYRRQIGRTLGWAGRANGPVDNPRSSCLSCHATAQFPAYRDFLPPKELTDAKKLYWFRNLKPGQAFGPEARSLGYSLQLAMGIQNFYEWVEIVQTGRSMKSASSSPDEDMCPPKASVSAKSGKSFVSSGTKEMLDSPEAHVLTIYRISRDEAEAGPLKSLSVPDTAPPPP